MSQLMTFLNNNKVGQFATIKEGQIMQRPFHFIFEKDNKFYFGTANDKEVYKELKATPTASFAVMGDNMQWLRLRGSVVFVDDMALKKEMFESVELLSTVYQSAENPRFEAFYLTDGEATLHGGMGHVVEKIAL